MQTIFSQLEKNCFILNIKGYLRYNMITSQNVSSEEQVKNFCIFNHPMIYQICDVMTSISTWDMAHFWICLLNHNSLSQQTWPANRYKQGQ